jgi:hypothetical protein
MAIDPTINEGDFRRFLELASTPTQWKQNQFERILRDATRYSDLLDDPHVLGSFEPIIAAYVQPPDDAHSLPEHVLHHVLSSKVHRRVLLAFIQGFVRTVPDGRMRARRVISKHIRSCSTRDLVCESADPSFVAYVVASNLIHGADSRPDIAELDRARGAMKAVARAPAVLETACDLIAAHFEEIDTADVVAAALASDAAMKFVLSRAAALVMGGSLKGCEIMQRIAGSGKGEPARIVADLLQQRQRIDCLLSKTAIS